MPCRQLPWNLLFPGRLLSPGPHTTTACGFAPGGSQRLLEFRKTGGDFHPCRQLTAEAIPCSILRMMGFGKVQLSSLLIIGAPS